MLAKIYIFDNLNWTERKLTNVNKGERFRFLIGTLGRLKRMTCSADLFKFLADLAAIKVNPICRGNKSV